MTIEGGDNFLRALRASMAEDGTISKERVREAFDIALASGSRIAEREFRKGAKGHLLGTMLIHLNFGRPIPKWARDAFIEACEYQPKSWDDVFGRPTGKGRRKKEEVRAYFQGSELREGGLTTSDPGDFFKKLGQKIGTSGGTAKRRYYSKSKQNLDLVREIVDELELKPEEIREWGDVIFFMETFIEAFSPESDDAE